MAKGKAEGLAFIVFLLLWSADGWAIGSFKPTQAELAFLPPYCAAKAGRGGNDANLPEVRKWMRILGKTYIDIHHYCDALLQMHRADLAIGDSITVNGYYQTALNNFEYLESRLPKDYMLNPEIYLMKGRLLLRMNQEGAALESFRRSIQFNEHYVPAYAALFDYYLAGGDQAKARAVVQQGLTAEPDSEALLRRQKSLGKEAVNAKP